MKRTVLTLTILSLVLTAGIVSAQQAAPAAQKKITPYTQVEENPDLPRVLILGDSISIGYTLPTRKLLDGVANVQRAPTNCGPTSRGLEQIDAWIGDKPWDVIHFNFGLHDLKYINDKGALVDVDQGKIQIPIDQYEKNLETLVQRLKKTGATLIFATTTPVPEGAKGRIVGDDVKYNEAALKVMKRHKIAVDDLYSFCKPQLEKIQLPANVHFTAAGSEQLAGEVARHIKKALAEPNQTKPTEE